MRELWTIVDARWGKCASMASYPTRESAERSIASVRHNVERGRRPDLVEMVDHFEPRRLPHSDILPGDVVPPFPETPE